jgi:hypothetical protein
MGKTFKTYQEDDLLLASRLEAENTQRLLLDPLMPGACVAKMSCWQAGAFGFV